MTAVTPLENWIREKTGMGRNLAGSSYVKALEDYQLRMLNKIIDYARRTTPFYRRHLASLPVEPLSALSDINAIPFTNPSHIMRDPASFLAVRQDDIARIVTLHTSGSTGESKRLFFTEEDLELTVDFFHHGMSTLVRPGQRVLVFLPGERPDSVGDLLVRGLQRMEVRALVYGPITDPLNAAQAIATFAPHCLVGIPTQVLSVARSRPGAAIGKGVIESVLLSTDYVPQAIVKTLREVWGCRVFNHYGMTEMGLGGGVECAALQGYHLREADLYFEIVDHESGEVCPDGTIGEVVFTTLTRTGMPLIRYRTGDISRLISRSCPCGSVLRRMERVGGRWEGIAYINRDGTFGLPNMDEVLFQLPGLLDYRATLSQRTGEKARLYIDVKKVEGVRITGREVLQALNRVDTIRIAIAEGHLEIPVVRFSGNWAWTTTGTAKRKIATALSHVPEEDEKSLPVSPLR